MNRDSEVSRALARIAAEDATLEPPQDLERRVMTEVRAMSGRRRWPARIWVLAAACVALVALALGAWPTLGVRPTPTSGPSSKEEPFSPLPYAAPAAPFEQLEVKRQEVSVAALVAAGFEVKLADRGAMVSADVLVGQDGRPLAVRLSPEGENRR